MNTSTLSKWWNSYGVRIPREALRKSGHRAGTSFQVSLQKNGSIVLQPQTDNFDHLYAQMSQENQHELIGTTYEIGKEIVIW